MWKKLKTAEVALLFLEILEWKQKYYWNKWKINGSIHNLKNKCNYQSADWSEQYRWPNKNWLSFTLMYIVEETDILLHVYISSIYNHYLFHILIYSIMYYIILIYLALLDKEV